MKREFGLDVRVGRPKVSYRETITKPAKSEIKYVKQTGGHGQYAHVVLEVEPSERGSGIQFESSIFGGVIPKEFIPSVERGVREAGENGVLARYPVVDVKVKLVDGSFHPVDSSDLAFKVAGSMAFKDAVNKGAPILLEPIMALEVVVPTEYLGEVLSHLSTSRARICKVQANDGLHTLRAEVPLEETFGFATRLRSLTQGRGTHTLEFLHYAPAPREVINKVCSEWRRS